MPKLLVDKVLFVRKKVVVVSQSQSLSSKQVGLSTLQSKSQEIEMNKMEEKEMPPISKSLEIFGPRHAKGVVVARKEGNRHLV
jgi:hypothetical protein